MIKRGLLLLTVLMAFLIADVLWPGSGKIGEGPQLASPSMAHPLGTDDLGRDLLARTAAGLRLSILIGLAATGIAMAIALPLGLLMGWARGAADELFGRLLDLSLGIPPLLFVLLIVAITGSNATRLATGLGIIFAPHIARIVRSEVTRLREKEFIEASLVRGESRHYILAVEILPNVIPLAIVEATFRFGLAIQVAAALSFLGLGVQPPNADLGLLIANARAFLGTHPGWLLAAAVILSILIWAVNMLGDGLRDYRDPRLRAGR